MGLDPSTAADIVAITHLLHQYCWAHDFGTGADVAACFAPQGEVTAAYHRNRSTYTGRAAIAAWYQRDIETIGRNSDCSFRRVCCPVIEVEGDRGRGVCYFDADGLQHEGVGTEQAQTRNHEFSGIYEDEFIRLEGNWYFQRRVISLLYSYPCLSHNTNRNLMDPVLVPTLEPMLREKR